MQITEHAQSRLQKREIDEWQMKITMEHGEWNARGDRLTLGERHLRKLVADRQRSLRKLEGRQSARSTKAKRFAEGRE